MPVVLCEKGHIGAEQSSRNWGWCRKMGRDPREIPLAIESLRLWRGMNQRVGRETGFRQHGIALSVRDAEKEIAKREAWLKSARPYQLDTRLLARDEAEARCCRAHRPAGMGGALHAERRPRRAAEGRAGDRRGGARGAAPRC